MQIQKPKTKSNTGHQEVSRPSPGAESLSWRQLQGSSVSTAAVREIRLAGPKGSHSLCDMHLCCVEPRATEILSEGRTSLLETVEGGDLDGRVSRQSLRSLSFAAPSRSQSLYSRVPQNTSTAMPGGEDESTQAAH